MVSSHCYTDVPTECRPVLASRDVKKKFSQPLAHETTNAGRLVSVLKGTNPDAVENRRIVQKNKYSLLDK